MEKSERAQGGATQSPNTPPRTPIEYNGDFTIKDGVLCRKYPFSENGESVKITAPDHYTEFTVPDGITEIGANTFRGCTKLEKITIPQGVAKIGRAAFAFCENLKSISIPQSVKEIGDMAFRGCENLQSVEIPQGVEKIERFTFWDCKNLKSVSIPQSVKTIGENAFASCGMLDEETKSRIGEIAG